MEFAGAGGQQVRVEFGGQVGQLAPQLGDPIGLPGLAVRPAELVHEVARPRPQRWRVDLADGDTLVHTDLAADNILIRRDETRIIDWAWPARGPAWADTAMLIPRLIRAGHTPVEAERWAATVPAWRDHRTT